MVPVKIFITLGQNGDFTGMYFHELIASTFMGIKHITFNYRVIEWS